jgi:hypothetical protein
VSRATAQGNPVGRFRTSHADMIGDIARHPQIRDEAIFVGDPEPRRTGVRRYGAALLSSAPGGSTVSTKPVTTS